MKGRRYKEFSEILMLIYSTNLECKTKKSKPTEKRFVSKIFMLKDFRQFLQLSSPHTACEVSTRILTRLKESFRSHSYQTFNLFWLAYARVCKRNPDRSSFQQHQNIYFNKLILDLSATFCIFFIKKKKQKKHPNKNNHPSQSFCYLGKNLLSPKICYLHVIPCSKGIISWF